MIVAVIALAHMVLGLVVDLIGLLVLAVRPRRSIEAENLILRRQLALFRSAAQSLGVLMPPRG